MGNDTTSGADFQGAFREYLVASGKSPHTIAAYMRDVRLFGEWFDRTNGKELAPGRITPSEDLHHPERKGPPARRGEDSAEVGVVRGR
jgi:hypothetical protein